MRIQYIIGRLKRRKSVWMATESQGIRSLWMCANCHRGTDHISSFDYCPDCGSKMVGFRVYHTKLERIK